MSILRPFLAQNIIPTDVLPESWHWMGLTLRELLTVLGAVGLVTLPVILWAVYLRKGPGRRSHRHHHHHQSREVTTSSESPEDPDGDSSAEKRYRRKRRRRRDHRPRNPTLAETGGLPPVRSERPPDPLR